MALMFLGTRGIWDPDEGRYTNVSLVMLDTHDWIHPRRNDEVGHWTKPPLTYWAVAASIAAFGTEPWAARLPMALSYLTTALLVGLISRRLRPGSGAYATTIYACMAMPVQAAGLVTTDYLLTAFETLAIWAFVESRFSPSTKPKRWIALMWCGFALAFLTKGPPALLPLLSVLLFNRLSRTPSAVLNWSGILLFALLALPWYVAVVLGTPGLLGYFIGDEMVKRVATDDFGRNGEWYGWAKVYVPTLILGSLPWTADLFRWASSFPAQARRCRNVSCHSQHAPALLLGTWLLLPLVVFCVSQSRLPLYVLPLFAPLSLLIAHQRLDGGRPLPRIGWLIVWIALMLGTKLAGAWWPTDKNAAEWALAIRARAPGEINEVLFVQDMARYGLHLHLGIGTRIEKISIQPVQEPAFHRQFDDSLAAELGDLEPGVIWIVREKDWNELRQALARLGYQPTRLGSPFYNRIIFSVSASAPRPSASAPRRRSTPTKA